MLGASVYRRARSLLRARSAVRPRASGPGRGRGQGQHHALWRRPGEGSAGGRRGAGIGHGPGNPGYHPGCLRWMLATGAANSGDLRPTEGPLELRPGGEDRGVSVLGIRKCKGPGARGEGCSGCQSSYSSCRVAARNTSVHVLCTTSTTRTRIVRLKLQKVHQQVCLKQMGTEVAGRSFLM